MVRGATIKVLEMLKRDELGGIISFGGVSNTTSATNVMKTLPFGIPKFMISSAASMPAYAASFIGTDDITMMHSVVELAGLNDLTRAVYDRGAGAVCGMARASDGTVALNKDRTLIALSGFKFSEKCNQKVMGLLEQKGYGVISFHSQGVGDRVMEELMGQDLFDGVIDVVPAGVNEQMLGGTRAAGPHRLEGAGKAGIPQVVTPCGFDMISCGPLERKETDDPQWTRLGLHDRRLHMPDEFRVEARTSADELLKVAETVAQKLNQADGPVKFLIPTRGWSSLSVEGADLHDPEADALFASALRSHVSPNVQVIEKETTYDSNEFAQALVEALEDMLKK